MTAKGGAQTYFSSAGASELRGKRVPLPNEIALFSHCRSAIIHRPDCLRWNYRFDLRFTSIFMWSAQIWTPYGMNCAKWFGLCQ